jgi:hypothetical protein
LPVFLSITHLLLPGAPSKLTYNLYLRFFGLIDSCPDAMALWIAADAAVVMCLIAH